jgi:hypothetical protein
MQVDFSSELAPSLCDGERCGLCHEAEDDPRSKVSVGMVAMALARARRFWAAEEARAMCARQRCGIFAPAPCQFDRVCVLLALADGSLVRMPWSASEERAEATAVIRPLKTAPATQRGHSGSAAAAVVSCRACAIERGSCELLLPATAAADPHAAPADGAAPQSQSAMQQRATASATSHPPPPPPSSTPVATLGNRARNARPLPHPCRFWRASPGGSSFTPREIMRWPAVYSLQAAAFESLARKYAGIDGFRDQVACAARSLECGGGAQILSLRDGAKSSEMALGSSVRQRAAAGYAGLSIADLSGSDPDACVGLIADHSDQPCTRIPLALAAAFDPVAWAVSQRIESSIEMIAHAEAWRWSCECRLREGAPAPALGDFFLSLAMAQTCELEACTSSARVDWARISSGVGRSTLVLSALGGESIRAAIVCVPLPEPPKPLPRHAQDRARRSYLVEVPSFSPPQCSYYDAASGRIVRVLGSERGTLERALKRADSRNGRPHLLPVAREPWSVVAFAVAPHLAVLRKAQGCAECRGDCSCEHSAPDLLVVSGSPAAIFSPEDVMSVRTAAVERAARVDAASTACEACRRCPPASLELGTACSCVDCTKTCQSGGSLFRVGKRLSPPSPHLPIPPRGILLPRYLHRPPSTLSLGSKKHRFSPPLLCRRRTIKRRRRREWQIDRFKERRRRMSRRRRRRRR